MLWIYIYIRESQIKHQHLIVDDHGVILNIVDDSIRTSRQPTMPSQRREYPRGLGDSVHEVYLQQLKGPAHGDLRVRITPDENKSDVELFKSMELGDCWDDANLKPCYGCKHTRTMVGIFSGLSILF